MPGGLIFMHVRTFKADQTVGGLFVKQLVYEGIEGGVKR